MDEKTDKTQQDGEVVVEDDDSDDSGSSSEEADGRHITATLVITPADERGPEEAADDTREEKLPIHDMPSTEPGDISPVSNDNTDEHSSTTEAKPDEPPSLNEEDTNKQTSPDGAETDKQSAITDAENAERPPSLTPDGAKTDKKSVITDAENAERPSSLSEAHAEVSTQQGHVARQMALVRQELVTDTWLEEEQEQELELEAACSLRRSSPQDSSGPHEVLVEMDTFNRSSTRRDSFVMAIASGEEREMDTSMFSRTSGIQKMTDGHSSAAQDHNSDFNLEAGSISDVEDLELFFPEESSPWDTISECCRGRRRWVICGTALLLLALVFPIILIPQSLVYVEYYQIALARSRVTGRVDRERTLYGGCYLLFPDSELIVFKATAHHVHRRLQVTAADGLSLGLEISLQYFIKGEELGQLHLRYGQHYEDVVHTVVESEVKNSVVNFTLEEYRLHRDTVEQAIHRQLALRLQGDCCPGHCVNNASQEWGEVTCSSPCNISVNCSSGLHMSLLPRHVQLGAVDIPNEVSERYLRFILLQVEAEKETLLQEATVEKKRTELLTRDVRNRAHEIVEDARSTSKKLRVQAEADAELKRQKAHNQALQHLLTSLNITAPDERHSLLLLLAYKQTSDPVFFLPLGGLSVWG